MTFDDATEVFGGPRAVPADAGVHLLVRDGEASVALALGSKLDLETWAWVPSVPTPSLGAGYGHLIWSEFVKDPNVPVTRGAFPPAQAGPGEWAPSCAMTGTSCLDLLARFGSIAQSDFSRSGMRVVRIDPPYVMAASPSHLAVERFPDDGWVGAPEVLHVPGAAVRTLGALAKRDPDDLALLGRAPGRFMVAYGGVVFWCVDPGWYWPVPAQSAAGWFDYHADDVMETFVTSAKDFRAGLRRSPGVEHRVVMVVEYQGVPILRNHLLAGSRYLRGNVSVEVPRSADGLLVFRDSHGGVFIVAPMCYDGRDVT